MRGKLLVPQRHFSIVFGDGRAQNGDFTVQVVEQWKRETEVETLVVRISFVAESERGVESTASARETHVDCRQIGCFRRASRSSRRLELSLGLLDCGRPLNQGFKLGQTRNYHSLIECVRRRGGNGPRRCNQACECRVREAQVVARGEQRQTRVTELN